MPEMTERPDRVIVKPEAESRLESLLCLYETYKADADAANARYDELKKGIQAELEALYPEETRPAKAYDIPGGPMWPAITLGYKSQTYLATALIKEHLPQVYETFTRTQGRWELRKKQGKNS